LPDFDAPGRDIRSPQNPFHEEASAVRIMNAVRRHAQRHGTERAPVFSPWPVMLDNDNPEVFIDHRAAPPEGSGLQPASSAIFNVDSMHAAGYPVVAWTVNDQPRMLELMALGVDGLISDRPDVLRQAVEAFDADGDGIPGDFIGPDGLIDRTRFDAQGHRGGRDLRPENTLPAMEVALDHVMTMLETDTGVTADGVPVLNHDPYVQAQTCRRADGAPYTEAEEVLVTDLAVAALQSTFICDQVFRGPAQVNDRSLSPVSVTFAQVHGLIDPYVMPTLPQLFAFVDFYIAFYSGSDHPDAERRRRNARHVRFNIETKLNPRAEFAARTIEPEPFARAVAHVIVAHELDTRADIQSFDFRPLLVVQEEFPAIRPVYLFGDFPVFADRSLTGSDDGTNLQDEHGANTPWLAGLFWPYRVTALDHPFRAQRSGGFEGMALTTDGETLLPLLEKPLVDGEEHTLLVHAFDLSRQPYTGMRLTYPLS
jgi:glycerophosphoryl diester phosphodiesterase